jgi:hypothetical protein
MATQRRTCRLRSVAKAVIKMMATNAILALAAVGGAPALHKYRTKVMQTISKTS